MNKLKNFCDFQEGYVNPSQKISDYFGGSIKWLRASDLNGSLVYNTERNLSEKGFKSAGASALMFEKDTIAISKSGTIGELGILKDKMCANRAIINIKVKQNKSDLFYIFCLLKYKRDELIRKAFGGSIQDNLYISDLETIEVNHKDIDYQKKISKTLFPIFKKIEINKNQNDEVIKIIKLIFNYWFTQFEFPNSEGKPYKSSGGKMLWNKILNREIPNNWRVGTFKEVLKELESGDRPKGGITDIPHGIPSIGAENIISIGKYNFDEEKLVTKDYFKKMRTGIVKSGDVLMYKDGLSLGRVSMFKNDYPYKECCINSHVFILRTNEKISQNYLYFWLDQDFVKRVIISSGLSAAQPGINQKDVMDIPILIPKKELIKKFDIMVKSKIDMIFNNSKENKILNDQLEFFLPMIMNNQIKIS